MVLRFDSLRRFRAFDRLTGGRGQAVILTGGFAHLTDLTGGGRGRVVVFAWVFDNILTAGKRDTIGYVRTVSKRAYKIGLGHKRGMASHGAREGRAASIQVHRPHTARLTAG